MNSISIPLTNGGVFLIDESDKDFVMSYKWYGIKSRRTQYVKTGKNNRLHRMLMDVQDKTKIVDHINGNGLDNRRANLRIVTVSENVANRQNSKIGNKCPGVTKYKTKWRASICVNYKKINIGIFIDECDAISAINAYREKIGRPIVVIAN